MAALYWRVKGQGKKAIDCLRQALHYAPHQMKVSEVGREYLCVLLSDGQWLHAVSVRRPQLRRWCTEVAVGAVACGYPHLTELERKGRSVTSHLSCTGEPLLIQGILWLGVSQGLAHPLWVRPAPKCLTSNPFSILVNALLLLCAPHAAVALSVAPVLSGAESVADDNEHSQFTVV